jgi:hypothetical protein
MPTKKISNVSVLIDKNKFRDAIKENDKQELENRLTKLMQLTNQHYDATYRIDKNNPDIKKFSSCSENFKKIKSIIESIEHPTQLMKQLSLEAWISTLYSDVHALNLDPKSRNQVIALNEKIQAIETDFNLLTTSSHLDSKDKSHIRLFNYIEAFKKTWESKKNMLKGHSHYNFAETLVAQSQLKDAIDYFIQSANFYASAANSSKNNDKTELLKFKKQTTVRLNEIQKLLIESPLETTCVIKNPTLPKHTKIKRKSNEKPIYHEAKKVKKDPSLVAYPKKIRLETECRLLLDEFKQIGKYNLSIPSRKGELSRYSASLASKYALDTIEKLSFSDKNLSDGEKQNLLKKAKDGFSKSITYYSQAGLPKEKGKIIQCDNLLTSTIERFSTSLRKVTPKNSNTLTNRKPSFEKEIMSNGNSEPIYHTRTFFKRLSSTENNAINVDNQPNLGSKPVYSS